MYVARTSVREGMYVVARTSVNEGMYVVARISVREGLLNIRGLKSVLRLKSKKACS